MGVVSICLWGLKWHLISWKEQKFYRTVDFQICVSKLSNANQSLRRLLEVNNITCWLSSYVKADYTSELINSWWCAQEMCPLRWSTLWSLVPDLIAGDRARFLFPRRLWFQWWIRNGLWKTRIHHGITGAMTASSMVRVCPSFEISLSVMHFKWSPSKQIKICFSPNSEYCISIVLGKDIAHLAWRGCQYGPERYERLMKLRQAKQGSAAA